MLRPLRKRVGMNLSVGVSGWLSFDVVWIYYIGLFDLSMIRDLAVNYRSVLAKSAFRAMCILLESSIGWDIVDQLWIDE